MIIRPFTRADTGAVTAIHQASHPFPWPAGRYQAFSTLVAEVDGRIVAFACHSVLHTPDHEEVLLLANLAVHPAHRRRGLGRALLEARLRIGPGGEDGLVPVSSLGRPVSGKLRNPAICQPGESLWGVAFAQAPPSADGSRRRPP